MNKTNKNIVIEAICFENGKAYGYNEYLFNLLNSLYANIESIKFEEIYIVCCQEEVMHFERYKDKFQIKGICNNNYFSRLINQNLIRSKLNLNKKDLIVFTGNYSSLIKQCQHILVIHDLLYLRKNYLPLRLMRLHRRLYVPRSIKLADKIIAISEFTKNDIITHFNNCKHKIESIYNYIKFDKYEDNKIKQRQIQREYYLSICSSANHKNTITVLRAFHNFAEINMTYDLALVGGISKDNVELYTYYQSMPENIKNRIHMFKGISTAEIANLYTNSAAFISATLFEGLGMPIVEAQYFNLPCVLSDIDVCREVSYNNAMYFSPQDNKELSEILLSIAENKPKCETKTIVQTTYGEQNTTQKYIRTINSFY